MKFIHKPKHIDSTKLSIAMEKHLGFTYIPDPTSIFELLEDGYKDELIEVCQELNINLDDLEHLIICADQLPGIDPCENCGGKVIQSNAIWYCEHCLEKAEVM